MNVRAKERKPNYRQMAIIGIVILAGIYHFSRPTLEKWLDTSLPSLTGDSDQVANDEAPPKATDDFNYEAKLPDAGSKKSNPIQKLDIGSKGTGNQTARKSKPDRQNPATKTPANNNLSPGQAARNWLKDIGRNQFRSPAGLVYTGGREHRVDHVLKHCKDDPSKPTHGVFVGDAVEVMELVDEAYKLAKSGKAKPQKSDGKITYTVSMGRVVGHTGGRKAKRNGRKELRRVKIVLAENRVITAFPTN